MLGRCTRPTPERLLSPLQKSSPRRRSRQPPTSQCHRPPTAAERGCGGRGSRNKRTGDGVGGANESWGGFGVRVPTRRARGRAPRRVSSLSLGGPSVPSVHAQVRELHLVHWDGVVLGLAVGGCDGAGGAWRWPEMQEMEGGGLRRGLVRKQSLVQQTCLPAPLQVSPVPPQQRGTGENEPEVPCPPLPSRRPQPQAGPDPRHVILLDGGRAWLPQPALASRSGTPRPGSGFLGGSTNHTWHGALGHHPKLTGW